MEKVKKAIVYIWIFGLLIAMYSAEAWSYTYLRQYGSEHPKENLIFAILILAFLIPFAIILIVNKFKNKESSPQVEPHLIKRWGFLVIRLSASPFGPGYMRRCRRVRRCPAFSSVP